MNNASLEGIIQLMDCVFDSERAAFAKLVVREANLRGQLRELRASKFRPPQLGDRSNDPAMIAGADIQWSRWIDQRLEILNRELAQVLALKSIQQAELKHAFGRQQVTKQMELRVKAKAKTIEQGRESYKS